jgi:TfoX/Sxy family transcriptional regulator of competence genes
MAYDADLARRVRALLAVQPGLTEKHMFGGVAFMLQGNMACGVSGDELIVRVGPGDEVLVRQPGVRPFDMTGRPMKGWLLVGPEGYDTDASLQDWVTRGSEFALSLSPK